MWIDKQTKGGQQASNAHEAPSHTIPSPHDIPWAEMLRRARPTGSQS